MISLPVWLPGPMFCVRGRGLCKETPGSEKHFKSCFGQKIFSQTTIMKLHVFMDQSEVSALSTRYSRCLCKQLVFLVLFISVLELTCTAVSKWKESTPFLGKKSPWPVQKLNPHSCGELNLIALLLEKSTRKHMHLFHNQRKNTWKWKHWRHRKMIVAVTENGVRWTSLESMIINVNLLT